MIHFFVDILVAVPLFFTPKLVLSLVGFENHNVVLARIIAAALMGIGIESFLGRKASKESFLGMLRLKIIWSSFAILGLLISLLNREIYLITGGLLVGTFIIFNFVWFYWFFKLKNSFSIGITGVS